MSATGHEGPATMRPASVTVTPSCFEGDTAQTLASAEGNSSAAMSETDTRMAYSALFLVSHTGVGVNVTGGTRDTGTTRIAASGQLVYRAGVHYPAAHAGAAATFSFVIQGTDDNGHTVSVTLAVPTTG